MKCFNSGTKSYCTQNLYCMESLYSSLATHQSILENFKTAVTKILGNFFADQCYSGWQYMYVDDPKAGISLPLCCTCKLLELQYNSIKNSLTQTFNWMENTHRLYSTCVKVQFGNHSKEQHLVSVRTKHFHHVSLVL